MCNFLLSNFQYTVCSISSNEISSTIVFGNVFQYNMERIVSGVNNAEVCEIREQLCNKNGDGAADRRRPRPLITDNEVSQLITVIYRNSPLHLQSSELAAVTSVIPPGDIRSLPPRLITVVSVIPAVSCCHFPCRIHSLSFDK